MKKICNVEELNDAILQLENKQLQQLQSVKEQFHLISESYKPKNLIKSAFNEVTTSPDLKGNILNSVIGITTGYLSKKLFVGLSDNPIRKLLGGILQFGMTNVVSKHPDGIKSAGMGILHSILSKKEKKI